MQSAPAKNGVGNGVPAWAWAALALVLGAALTLLVSHAQQQRALDEHRAAFESLAADAFTSVQDSLRSCEVLLRSVQTVFLASGEVSAQEFEHLYQNLDPRAGFPSLQALAYADRRGPDSYVTTMVQPLAGNDALPGLDIATQPNNLAAVRMSRDTDEVAMSAPFRLVQQQGASLDGVTMRLPIYAGGPPPATLGERRARIRGSIAASFEARELIDDAIAQATAEGLWIRVADVTRGGATVLYESGTSPAKVHADYRRELRFGGRTWELHMRPMQSLGAAWPH